MSHRPDEARALLDTLLESAPVGISIVDRELRYLQINATLAAMNGLPPEAHIGRRPSEVVPDLAPALEPLLQRVFESGEPIVEFELSGETAAAPGERREWLESYYPVRDAGGAVGAVEVIVREVTAQRRAERERDRAAGRQRLLVEAGRRLAVSLDYQATLQSVARLSLPTLADIATVDLLTEAGGLRRVAAAHRDPSREAALHASARWWTWPSWSGRWSPTHERATKTARSRRACRSAWWRRSTRCAWSRCSRTCWTTPPSTARRGRRSRWSCGRRPGVGGRRRGDRGAGLWAWDPGRQARADLRAVLPGHTRTRSGMGLGLYISRQIVQLHGGELEAEFPEDGGSRFVVRLPIGDEQSGRPPPSA